MARLIDSVKGHETVWRNLLSLLGAGRLPHGIAFVGPAGIGRKKVALALAQAGLCSSADGPCGVCSACVRVENGQSESCLLIAPSGAILKLEQAQEILNFLSLRSLARRRFIVIDDAETMNPSFANALLKILEEPPGGTHFIFLTQAISRLLPTIRSRLQAVRFFPLADDVLAAASGASPWMIAAAGGSFHNLEEWSSPETSELKELAVSALEDLAEGRRQGWEALSSDIKEKQSAELTARLFQQFFRDAFYAAGKLTGVVHADCEKAFAAWKRADKAALLEIWRAAFQLQQDIGANLDRVLSFENFYYRARRRLENPNALLD